MFESFLSSLPICSLLVCKGNYTILEIITFKSQLFICGYIFLMQGPKNVVILNSANYVHSWVFLWCTGEPEYFFIHTTEKCSAVFFRVRRTKIIQIMKVLVKEHMLYVLWKCYINPHICKNYSVEWFLLYIMMYNSNPCELYELCFYMVFIHKSFESYIILFHVF